MTPLFGVLMRLSIDSGIWNQAEMMILCRGDQPFWGGGCTMAMDNPISTAKTQWARNNKLARYLSILARSNPVKRSSSGKQVDVDWSMLVIAAVSPAECVRLLSIRLIDSRWSRPLQRQVAATHQPVVEQAYDHGMVRWALWADRVDNANHADWVSNNNRQSQTNHQN